ncbi:hypothetical protein HDE_06078 [Halotydeus destructor]|nr:hypothetical protein HDE_06078 [Halotydeus destructor]
MLPRSFSSLTALALMVAIVLIVCIDSGDALVCERRNMLAQRLEKFSCPDSIWKKDEKYCCGTESNRYCCTKSKAKEHGMRSNNVQGSSIVKGIGAFFFTIFLIIIVCIGFCCWCVFYLVKGKRRHQGHVIPPQDNTMGGQSVHMVNQPYPSQPTGGYGYPTQPTQPQPAAQGYPGYPPMEQQGYQQAPAPYPAPYPSYPAGPDNPPPYPSGDASKPPPFNPGYPQ